MNANFYELALVLIEQILGATNQTLINLRSVDNTTKVNNKIFHLAKRKEIFWTAATKIYLFLSNSSIVYFTGAPNLVRSTS